MTTFRLARAMGRIALAAGTVATLALTSAIAEDNEFAGPLTDLGGGVLRDIASNPLLIAAVSAQNATSSAYDQAKIDSLDQQWRAEVSAADKPLIDATLATEASKWLVQAQEQSGGVFTEIFVMDAKGLNVAQSTVTSDYWQGDEDKFTLSFGAGAEAIHLGEIEQDESTQTFQSQVSIAIVDPATGAPIGAITAGVDLSML
jgi:hypothetical protein